MADQVEQKALLEGCPLCEGTGEILNRKARMMGYTLTNGETIDEDLIPCPLCERVKTQRADERQKTLREVVGWLTNHAAYTATVGGSKIQLPFLQPLDYERLYISLKKGDMPK